MLMADLPVQCVRPGPVGWPGRADPIPGRTIIEIAAGREGPASLKAEEVRRLKIERVSHPEIAR
jgi:hypothetical protein